MALKQRPHRLCSEPTLTYKRFTRGRTRKFTIYFYNTPLACSVFWLAETQSRGMNNSLVISHAFVAGISTQAGTSL